MSRSRSHSRSPAPSDQHSSSPKLIDRQSTTPFLLHLCYRSAAFHSLSDFPVPTPSDPKPPLPAHLQIYTWQSCTLRELAHLLTTALPGIVPDPAIGTRLSFRLVYPDTSYAAAAAARAPGRLGMDDEGGRTRGRYVTREMGSVVISADGHRHANGDTADSDSPPARGNGTGGAGIELGGEDADKTLAETRFVIGDFIDCAVFPPLSDGSIAPRSAIGSATAAAGGRYGSGYRENGFGGRGRGGYGRGNYGGHGGYGSGRGGGGGGFGESVPAGEWRRGERLPDGGSYRGGGGGGGGGSGGAGGGYRSGRGRRDPY